MNDYYVTSDAELDLFKIRDYTVSNWGAEQSNKYLIGLRDTFRLIAENSNVGTQRTDIDENVFSFPHVSHTLYYTIDNNRVIFFGVLHKSMIPEKHLLDREG